MDTKIELLFDYLRDILYDPDHASLDIDKLDGDLRTLGEGLQYFDQRLKEQRDLAKDLSKGNLSGKLPPPDNELAAPLKALHASLKHMTWQSQQVAEGDYQQRLDFMGEFSEAFNTMTKQLDQRRTALEQEIENSRRKTLALEQSNNLLASITNRIPQWIIVMDKESKEVLFINNAARDNLRTTPLVREELEKELDKIDLANFNDKKESELHMQGKDFERYFSLLAYPLQWSEHSAVAFVFNDISAEKEQLQKLENYAYQDPLTGTHNRFYGMQILREWLEGGGHFCICFADLDNLKYVNDNFGHSEGDKYIIRAATLLSDFSSDAMVARLGGDEFMVLVPAMTIKRAEKRMVALRQMLMDTHLSERRRYSYSLSYGIVEVKKDNTLSASELLGLADERMYEFKRAHKAERKKIIDELED